MKADLQKFDPEAGSLGVRWSVAGFYTDTGTFHTLTLDQSNGSFGFEFWTDMYVGLFFPFFCSVELTVLLIVLALFLGWLYMMRNSQKVRINSICA
jgi:hypothetical protein